MNVLDLFSGIGGFSLGLERAGMRTVAFCEIDPFARSVLGEHWPHVLIYDDVRSLTADRLASDGITVDVICGGFPCQDISTAGKGAGIGGERSGLWKEYARLVGELRPQFVVVENVAALLSRGLDVVLGDLASLGYDAEWHCIPASAVGAPHRRDRIWIVANPGRGRRSEPGKGEIQQQGRAEAVGSSQAMADAPSKYGDGSRTRTEPSGRDESSDSSALSYPAHYAAIGEGIGRGESAGFWWIEPDVGRVAHGIPDRTHRLKALGNAVVPQIPEIIGRAIMTALTSHQRSQGE
jgi:DNA (cytosine-5)-methyltransferase 1